MKKFVSLFLCMAMLVSLAACGSKKSDTPADRQSSADRDTLKVVMGYDPGTFDPGFSDDQSYYQTVRQIYEPLFKIDNDGTVEPWLCESYEYEDDVTLLVHLRDVKFSNGEPLTAEDVLWSFQRIKDEALPVSQINGLLLDQCEVVDDNTLRLVTDGIQASLLAMLAYPATGIGCKSAYEAADGDYLNGAAVGTGPYKVVEYFAGDRTELTANEYYWREGEPAMQNLQIRYISDSTSRATEAKAKGADIIININNRELDAVDAVDGMHVEQVLSASTTYLMMNTDIEPLNNPKVREAISYAINVEQTIGLVYNNFGSAASGMVCPGILGYDEDTYAEYFGHGYNPEKAKELLAEAGYPNGITLEVALETGDSARHDMAEAFQAQMQPAGITLSLNEMKSAVLAEYFNSGKQQLSMSGFTCSDFEADGMLTQIIPGSSNFSMLHYDDEEFLGLITKGSNTLDKNEREQIWKDTLENLASNYVLIPLWHKALVAGVSDNVENFELTRDYEEHYFQNVTLK